MATKKKSTPIKANLNVYILLDRSSSMTVRWKEALGSINAYVEKLMEEKSKLTAFITVVTFDDVAGIQFDTVRSQVPMAEWKALTDKDAFPRGGTPLYDAIGRIVSVANSVGNEKTIIAVMTDGEENSSKELTRFMAADAIKKCKDRDWQIIFLGADFDAISQAASVGVASVGTINMSTGNYNVTLRAAAEKSTAYATTGASMDWNAADRDLASGKKGTL